MKQREIKFRAWDPEAKKMIYKPETLRRVLYLETDNGFHMGRTKSKENGDWVSFDIMQYVGLKDKNGKEIYEGDIIQYKSYYANKRWWSKLEDIPVIEAEVQQQREDVSIDINVIKYESGCFTLGYDLTGFDIARGERVKRGSGNSGDFESKKWDFEVIGNVHENPELLTEAVH